MRLEVDLGVDMVQVHHTDAIPGDTVYTNADGLHRGRIKRVQNNSMQTLGDCWILFVDNFDVALGSISAIQDEYYGPGRLDVDGQPHTRGQRVQGSREGGYGLAVAQPLALRDGGGG